MFLHDVSALPKQILFHVHLHNKLFETIYLGRLIIVKSAKHGVRIRQYRCLPFSPPAAQPPGKLVL
jgi:hypothetical protein